MRIKGKYHLGVIQLIQHQILWTNIIGVVWQTVKRITAKEILGEKMLTLRWQEWTQFNEVLARVVLGCFVSYKSGLLLKKKGIEIWKMGKGVMSIPHRITRISENFTTSWLVSVRLHAIRSVSLSAWTPARTFNYRRHIETRCLFNAVSSTSTYSITIQKKADYRRSLQLH